MDRRVPSVASAARFTRSALLDHETSTQIWSGIDKYWDRVLDLCRWNADHSVDWEAARILFQTQVPEEIMRDQEFACFMTELFMRSCGTDEGLRGAKKVFARFRR